VDVPPKINSFRGKLLSDPFAVDLTWDVQGVRQCILAGLSETFPARGHTVVTPDRHSPVQPVYTLLAGEPQPRATAQLPLRWDRSAALKASDAQRTSRAV